MLTFTAVTNIKQRCNFLSSGMKIQGYKLADCLIRSHLSECAKLPLIAKIVYQNQPLGLSPGTAFLLTARTGLGFFPFLSHGHNNLQEKMLITPLRVQTGIYYS